VFKATISVTARALYSHKGEG